MAEASTDLLSSLREEYGPVGSPTESADSQPDLLNSLREEYGPADTSTPRSTLSEMGRQIGAGTVVDIPEMTGKAIQAFTEEGGAAHQFGKELRESAEARAPEWEPDLRDKNEVQQALVRGTRAMPASLAAAAPAFIPVAGPAISAAVTGAGFGGAQYQDTLEKLRAEGVPEDEAKQAALGTAFAQGGGEIIANRLTGGLLGAGGQAVSKTVGELTGKIAAGATAKEAAKQFGKAYAAELVGEPATEIAQDIGTEAIERAYGAKPTADYGDIAYQSGTTALAMSAMLGLPGAGGHYANKKIAERVDAALDDPSTSESARLSAVQGIYARAKREGIQDADQWYQGALTDIGNGAPVRRDAQPQAAEAPNITPEVIPEAPNITPEVIPEVIPEAPNITPEVTPEAPPVLADTVPQPEIPVEQPVAPETPDGAMLARGRDYVNRYKERMALGGIPTMVSKTLRDAAQTFGVYDPNLTPDAMLSALDAKVSELENAQKTPGQKIAEDIQGKGTISDILAANPAAIDATLAASQEQAAEPVAEQPAEEPAPVVEVPPQGSAYVTEDGEIIGEKPAEEPDYYAPDMLAQRDDLELKSLISAGNLSGPRLAAANAELLRRKGETDAIEEQSAAQPDVSGSAQPGLREEGRDTAVGGAGVSPGGQESGAVQPAASETPISQEITNDQSQNPAAEETAAEKPQEEITESGHPKYVKAPSLIDAALITERNKSALPEDQVQDGDYQRGYADFDGLHIAIENKAGSFRSGVDKDGKAWSQKMHQHYGEIGVRDGNGDLVTGADGDLVDVFINPSPRVKTSPQVFVIDQVDKDGNFDEHKVVLGHQTEAAATKAYIDNYEPGWQGLGAITKMSMPEFKEWLQTEDPKKAVHPLLQMSPEERLESAKNSLLSAVPDADINKLRGPRYADIREALYRTLTGDLKSPKYKVQSVNLLQGTFFAKAGIPEGASPAATQRAFQEWATGRPMAEPAQAKHGERINNRYRITGKEEILQAISKLGGLKFEGEIASVFGDYKGTKRDRRALFNTGANSKYASEAVEILQGYGYQIADEHQLVDILQDSLLYSETNGQNGKPFYTPEGAELAAERGAIAKEDESKTELESRVAALLDTAELALGPADRADFQASVDRGAITLDNIAEYENDLADSIAAQQKGYEPGPDDLLRGQDMRGANKPKPAVKTEINEDMFVESEADRQALERANNLAAIERAKDAKRNGGMAGTLEEELFKDITVQKDIQDVFENLLPNKSSETQAEARAKLEADPNAERMQYVEDNFLELLSELEQSGKVEIKC